LSQIPTSAKSNQAFIEVLPFDQLKTTLALQFEKVNESQLSGSDRDTPLKRAASEFENKKETLFNKYNLKRVRPRKPSIIWALWFYEEMIRTKYFGEENMFLYYQAECFWVSFSAKLS
jgi:hypothetical protein